MTRILVLLCIVFFVLMLLLFIAGIAGNTPGSLIAGLLLAGPAFVFTLGMAIGRASKEVAIVRRDEIEHHSVNSRQRVMRRDREPLS